MHVLFMILAFVFSVRADDYSTVTVKATALKESVYMLEGAGGNITALVGPDGTFMVDDDFAPMADKLIAKLKEIGGASPRFVVNTHFHYDHSGGNEIFGKTAAVIATGEVRERLASEQVLWHETHPAEPVQALPTLTYEKELNLHLNGESVRILHLPAGHTDGDSVVFFKNSKVVAMGDLYFSGMFPIFHPEHKGSLEGYVRNVEKVLELSPDDAQFVPGHGPLSGKEELRRFARMIRASIAHVKTGLRTGQTLAQIQKSGLSKEWGDFSHGYLTQDQWIALVYKRLKASSSNP